MSIDGSIFFISHLRYALHLGQLWNRITPESVSRQRLGAIAEPREVQECVGAVPFHGHDVQVATEISRGGGQVSEGSGRGG